MLIQPKVKGFICTTAHPVGCAANVDQQINYVKAQGTLEGAKHVLIIGASTGYGLASRITAAFGLGAKTLGVFFERPATGKRTASAGWYNTAAFEQQAEQAGLYAKSINGDAFSEEIKQQTIDLIKQDFPDGIDLVIYSLASPKRTNPQDGQTYSSTLKPTKSAFTEKTVNVMTGEVSEVHLDPASDKEIEHTKQVMGGDDWYHWMETLNEAGVLANQVKTLAYSYIGPPLTFPIYRSGTIGLAKEHMEATVERINTLLQPYQGKAYVSVNKGLVTQASSAIPIVPLYFALLFKVMKTKGTHEGCIEQIWRLFNDRLFPENLQLDDKGRIRIDDWELQPDVQAEVEKLWTEVSSENVDHLSDIAGYREDFYKLFGFNVPSVDYAVEVNPDVSISSIPKEPKT